MYSNRKGIAAEQKVAAKHKSCLVEQAGKQQDKARYSEQTGKGKS
jgi:hypothetical protein